MNSTTFIYALKEPDTGIIRYIGKSDNPVLRWVEHSKQAAKGRRAPVCCWIRKLTSLGQIPSLETLDEVLKSEWQVWEKEYIRLFRALATKPLLNVSAGGDGGVTSLNPGSWNRGRVAWNKGKKMSASDVEKNRRSHTGLKQTEEACKKVSDSLIGNKRSLGHRQKPEHRQNISSGLGNAVGMTGVHKVRNRYRAKIRVGGKARHLGYFLSPEEAHLAYLTALEKESQ